MEGDIIITDDSAREAQIAAENANMAATAAASASVAQAQLIGQVMAAGREDAAAAAAEAKRAANEAESAATDAVVTNVAVMGQFQRFHDEVICQLQEMRNELADLRRVREEPEIKEESPQEEEIVSIQPEGQDNKSKEDSEESDNTASDNRRRVGRAKRRSRK